MHQKKSTVLVILDGFGYHKGTIGNAIAQAKNPTINSWLRTYPNTLLKSSGTAVGLPEGYIGNSEVGHITIGSGRIVQQPLTIINNAITDGSFSANPTLVDDLKKLQTTGKSLHIIGLLSDAGIHSNQKHLYAFLQAAADCGIKNIIVHPFLDGRDTPPQSAAHYLQELETFLHNLGCGIIGSIHGRFYAMDRDHHWQRTEQSYHTLTMQQTNKTHSWQEILKESYANDITDEFIKPIQLTPKAVIKSGSGIIFFNIRPDRARQLTQCFVDTHFDKFPTQQLNLTFFITPVTYSSALKTDVLFEHPVVPNTLKEVLDANNKSMLAVAETEKYAHVTYFFAGGKEKVFHNETRILVPSIEAITYVKNPEMSAEHITQVVIKSLKKVPKDFYIINYANADMVGHSGDLQATIKAIECLDRELKKLFEIVVEQMDGTMYVTADHGKAEEMINADGTPRTAHTTNCVPFIMLRKDLENSDYQLPLTQLADIAPFILETMGLSVPNEMKR
ncbi:MAG: 2,3-bisphosphoglycerate-independent phosphoglycerate mutase [Candidatus Dependentiae bacterium]|nr:2,3-bisphosphoglycerate-independent phosphoglycerate mutase [Candidatus Dependentiae bacterium]